MLKLVKIKDQSEKIKFLIGFKAEDSAFIVSDIKTKLFLESELLKKYFHLPGACVMRANEFYKELFYSLDNKWRLMPDSYVKELLFDFCKDQKQNWIKNLQNSHSFFEFFNSFLVVFLYKESLKAFEEWLEVYKKNLFWKSWFQLSQSFFEFLSAKQMLSESGAKSLLLHDLSSTDSLPFSKDKILVDLSFSLDLCEKEIFKELARHKEVYILSPHLKYAFFENKFDIYKKWEEELDKEKILKYPSDNTEKTNPSRSLFKIKTETQIEEVKKAVVQTHQWIKQGVAPSDIVIYAPNLENYWFVLRSYLEKENIPFKKTIYSKLIDFREIKHLLSSARIHLNLFTFEDLELFCFYKESKKDFLRFKENYFNEPKRDLVKKLLFQNKIKDFNQRTTGFGFVQWLLSFWPKTAEDRLLDALLAVLQKLTVRETLTYKSWLRFFESELFSKELEISAEQAEGVSCLSFNAFHSVKSPYVFILGLTESALKGPSLFFSKESEDILEDLGLPIAIASSKQKENSLLWFLQSSHYKELYLSCHSYDFKGDLQNASLLYMLSDRLFSAKKTDILESLSWDHKIKQGTLAEILSDKPEDQAEALEQAFQNKIQPIFPYEKSHLSANSIKTYRDCPFKYAGEKLFFVPPKQAVQREVSALSQGKSVHKLFELALRKHPNLKVTEEQLNQIIDNVQPTPEKFIHKKQWLLMKEYLKRLLKEFLIKEKEQRENSPHLKPVAFEAKLKAFWDQKKGELSHQGDYVFKGFLDRVDQDEETKQYALRDYKASSSLLSPISSWLKTEELQLTFYAQALEKGLVENLPAGAVSALFYSVYNDKFATKGFVEKDSSLLAVMQKTRGHEKEKKFLYEAIDSSNRYTQKMVAEMEKGNFSPNPIDPKNCK
ncbi:MAG: PD-(D/E)XK nuclease family protein, partial [Oligoflexia bacterium]|nr:PD-(D/E)XK nuclease family protein [Oligoflexia bacterium]